MARIRSIKPELPQSETLGRTSRDARLLFVFLFTLADDAGRARASSRLLASLLFPYDDDAFENIDGWLRELDSVGAVRVYQVGDTRYVDIPAFNKHQKIDRPSAPKYPGFDEGSRVFVEGSRGLVEGSPPDGMGGERRGEEIYSSELNIAEQNKPATGKRSPGRPAGSLSKTITADGFPAFWSAYPRKVNKPAALKAWAKLKPTPESLAAILAAVERAKRSEDWQRDAGKYIPHPATWLNGERWNDELDSAAIGAEEFNAGNNFGMPPGVHPVDAGVDSPNYKAYQRARFSV